MTQTEPRAGRDQVFSYTHRDREWLERLQTMLKPLLRQGTLRVWADTQIKPGDIRRQEIEQALASAAVAVLLVSANFLASDFIAEHELPPLLEAAKREGVKILWVAVSYCLVEESEIERYQAVNDPTRPLSSFSGAELDRELYQIAKAIKSATLKHGSASKPAQSQDLPLTTEPVGQDSRRQSNNSSVTGGSLSPSERLALIRTLNALPPPQFNQIVFALNMPPELIPGAAAAHGERTYALLNWAEALGGCGLRQVKQVLDSLLGSQQPFAT